jgi:hypothetical protein
MIVITFGSAARWRCSGYGPPGQAIQANKRGIDVVAGGGLAMALKVAM